MNKSQTRLVMALFLGGLVITTGCVGAAAQLLYVLRGTKVDAKYDGLEGKRVAVLCVSDASAYGPDTLSFTIARALASRMSQEVKQITVVPQAEIGNWIDVYGGEQDFIEIGRGVNADMVVAVEVGSYTIRNGPTLLKGRAVVTTTVYDLTKGGEVAFVHGPAVFEFPRSAGRSAINTDEAQFESLFLSKLVEYIGWLYYDHDRMEEIADDASMLD